MIAQEKLFGVLVLLVLCVNTAVAINKGNIIIAELM
jgi:hypothetical protein